MRINVFFHLSPINLDVNTMTRFYFSNIKIRIQEGPIQENIPMLENTFERFPVLFEKILSNLDDKNLVNIKVVSRKICSLVQKERLLWIRNIEKFIGAE